MKPEVTLKYLSYLRNKKNKGQEGFTLIELLVVVIIIGVLAAVALPNLLGQVGKARESEGKNGVGAINRAQQAHHFEKQTFANGTDVTKATNALGTVVVSDYYTFAVTGAADTSTNATKANQATKDGVREYSGGVGFNAGNYLSVVCQSNDIGGTATAQGTGSDCTAGTALK
ncbi:type IV pilin-like G/H family protein [Cyanobacterium aponinum UTEX 3221]|uniref:type IV pilin protein n=1 Tax=Cyanobacterium aponinum TaxID=379064 RepID=UPI002B4C1CD0|nr:type IV pilin-like G/H family protein [Cyanobacterium aponinum]WRL37725.1 type IV pilin-like G/H family protein [Cyanobacterium aponinum UTEX 3221]